jgi:hypothetical protein
MSDDSSIRYGAFGKDDDRPRHDRIRCLLRSATWRVLPHNIVMAPEVTFGFEDQIVNETARAMEQRSSNADRCSSGSPKARARPAARRSVSGLASTWCRVPSLHRWSQSVLLEHSAPCRADAGSRASARLPSHLVNQATHVQATHVSASARARATKPINAARLPCRTASPR